MKRSAKSLITSFECLINDIATIRCSDLTLQQLVAVVDEELQKKAHHMEVNQPADQNNDLAGNRKRKRSGTSSFALSVLKWSTGMLSIIFLAFLICPYRTVECFVQSPISILVNSEYNFYQVDWFFFIYQMMRLSSTTFRIEEMYPLIEHDMDSCIVDNPLYKKEKEDCSVCKDIDGFDNGYEFEASGGNVVLLFKAQEIEFSLLRFRQIVEENPLMINRHTLYVKTNCDYIRTVEDLQSIHVLNQLKEDSSSHIEGTSVSYMASHVLRKEFPRPKVYMENASQTFRSYIYIDGKNSSSYVLPKSIYPINFMYIQSTGSRHLKFSPPHRCRKKCQNFSGVINKGDIVVFTNFWNIQSESSQEESLSFVDTFE